jgi:molybdopterin-dependent oxidoreductase alpha subunit
MSLLRRFWRWLQLVVPFGLLVATKPRHYREMLRVLWRNRGRWRYAMRILSHGVCDGCSLGPRGLRDDVIEGVHLCLTRLGLLELNTMRAIPDAALGDIRKLRAMSNEELHRLGRVPYPLLRRPGEPGFRRISWEEAVRHCAESIARTQSHGGGDKMAFFVSSRGLTNEAYYAIQKLARIAGTANIDSCARLCHAASATGLKMTIGWGAPTCSLSDIIGTDLLVLIGTDLANNQPVTTKYMHFAKEQGTRIVVVNPFREPALERYWVPSVAKSALWGTPLMDDFFAVRPGGDIAFMLGVMKALDARNLFDDTFIKERTTGFAELREEVRARSWDEIADAAGLPRDEIERFADLYGGAERAVLLYSMGLTQYAFGVDNVKMVVNLALCRGNIGREKTGIIPIRGHSGVQGTAECGVDSDKLPGSVEITDESCAKFEAAWGHPIPHKKGLKAAHALDAAARGEIDFMYLVGGNFLDTMPDPENARRGLARPRVRVHQDIVLNTSTLVDAEELVLVLPAQTRYESGGTSTSTERRVRFSPVIEDPDGVNIAEARAEWLIPALIGRALPTGKPCFPWQSTADVRAEMGRTMPLYAGIEGLRDEGEFVQWGGARLGTNGFPNMPDGRARFSTVAIPTPAVPEGKLMLATRRGKQFNSITYGQKDPITDSSRRDVVLFHADDLAERGLSDGDRVVIRSEAGVMEAMARIGPCRRRHVQAFWPEANVLLARVYDPVSGEPDYNAVVTVERATKASRTSAAASSPPAVPPAARGASSPTRASSGRG